MSNVYERQVARALEAVRVRRDGLYWFGERNARWPSARASGGALLEQARRTQLQRCLYEHFFTTGGAQPRRERTVGAPDARADAHLTKELAAAAREVTVDRGWAVEERRADGTVVAVKNGLRVMLAPRDFVPADARGGGRKDEVSVRSAGLLPGRSPGFAVVRPLVEDCALEPSVIRVYWHVRPWLAARLVRELRAGLHQTNTPFSLKVADHPARYYRCDAAVLYVAAADLATCSEIVGRIYRDLASSLPAAVPALTWRAAPGLGVAADPGNGDSFGMHRCGLIAAAILDAADAGVTRREWLQCVGAALAENGVSLDAPYARADAPLDREALAVLGDAATARPRRRGRRATPSTPVAIAEALGRRIVAEAIWYEGVCTWVEEVTSSRGAPSRVGALSGDVYGGTAGIALFLADLCRVTGGSVFGTAAAGAMRHALGEATAGRLSRLGLHLGPLGVALAARRVGAALGRPELEEAALELVATRSRPSKVDRLGVVSGIAGDVLALAAIARDTGDRSAAELAVRAGSDLSRALDRVDARRLVRRGGVLTGYAHGASGIACALLALVGLTGDSAPRETADRLLASEDSLLTPEARNWPDLRFPARPPVHSVAWCHGAGGIALARIEAGLVETAAIALATVATCVSDRTTTTVEEESLCHGLPGLVDILAIAQACRPELMSAITEDNAELVVQEAFETVRRAELWQSSLMKGAAGVGMLALRTFAPQVESPLTLGLVLYPGCSKGRAKMHDASG